jgi:hypothetical protein
MNSWVRSACYPRRTFYPLSDGTSTRYRRITKSCFRTCSTCKSRSQAPLCLYTLRMITNHAEGTFESLRYNFRRRPPQSNYPPNTVPDPDSRTEVRIQIKQGWYFTVGSTEASAPASKPPTYPTHALPEPNVRVQ